MLKKLSISADTAVSLFIFPQLAQVFVNLMLTELSHKLTRLEKVVTTLHSSVIILMLWPQKAVNFVFLMFKLISFWYKPILHVHSLWTCALAK